MKRVPFAVLVNLSLALTVLLTACAPTASSTPRQMIPTAAVDSRIDAQQVRLSTADLDISLPRPNNWESFTTEYGVVLGEQFGNVASGGSLEGIILYLFASPLEDYLFPATDSDVTTNTAERIQRRIVTDPDYIGSARVQDPRGFTWDAHEAAYYLLRDDSIQAYSMVFHIVAPGSDHVVICTISAPLAQRDRIRAALPQLLDGLQINGHTLSGEALNTLPDPLDFPDED